MHQIIICADDYGLTASVNRAIEACLKAGAVQSTCVMANMEFAADAKDLAATNPNVAMGIHWTLTIGRPLAPVRQVPSLVDDGGCFHNFSEFRKRLRTGRISFDEVRLELNSQLEHLKGMTSEIEFWNAHQNAHLWPGLFQLCVDLALSAGIKRMRSNSRITLVANRLVYGLKNLNYIVKGMVLDFWASSARRKGMSMPDGLIAMPGAGAGKIRLEEYLERFGVSKRKRVMEATLHPAADANDTDNPLHGKLTESRYKEYKAYTDGGLKDRLSKKGYQCVSFRNLARNNLKD